MSESERDIQGSKGDLATSTPPEGTAPVEDPYAHHAYAPEEPSPVPGGASDTEASSTGGPSQ